MKLTKLSILIEPAENESDIGIASRKIEMNGNEWNLPSSLYPREIRFIARLEELIREFNLTRK